MSNSLRNPALPFLPGFTLSDPTRTNFAKSHTFDVRNGVAVFDGSAPGIGGSPLPGQRPRSTRTQGRSFASTVGVSDESLPSFIAFDRKVLRFFAYFQEGVVETRYEAYRVRRVKIYYYLEDDSIQVNESRDDNSGIPQGVLLKRHQVPKTDDSGAHYTFDDLNLGTEVTFYGITYRIVDCDEFTKNFFQRANVALGPVGEYPVDPHAIRQAESRPHPRQTVAPNPEKLALRQFLRNDRQVLRFFAVWDDREQPYAGASVFARRQRLPRQLQGLPDPRTCDYVRDNELAIGHTLTVFNRPFLLYDADGFTKQYYRERYGRTEAELTPLTLPRESKVVPVREIPPYQGIGSEEDSLASVTQLVPKPPKRHISIRPELGIADERIFRFQARFAEPGPEDSDRRFIISAFLADETLAVFEPPLRNSGVISGKFMERRRVKRAGSDTEYIKPWDLHVGEVINISGHRFLLLEADDYTYRSQLAAKRGCDFIPPGSALITVPGAAQQEAPVRRPGQPSVVDVQKALGQIKGALAQAGTEAADIVRQCETEGSGQVPVTALRRCLVEWGLPMTEEIALALMDEFDPVGTGSLSGQAFISAIDQASPLPLPAVPAPSSTAPAAASATSGR
ncbi:putative flagellar protofilament ribbon protein rib74 [Paratrimastix pyriformis]|uniref:Flagellar protofilament ribbon protein rib74 n=1 Tax=Paratrimastix pyriformis TaxID=342808 RepID=A0ABQ8UEV6_9EUKA|nr:putative flagellar protofilament ribbon protein rib74 [Paratrimastix pyriformis]